MKSFASKIAVVTGGGSGIGLSLARPLVAEGCSVALLDISPSALAEAEAICKTEATGGARISAHRIDVADEAQWLRVRDEVAAAMAADHIDLLFNNAGIVGGGSFVTDDRDIWDRTFDINWRGVYLGVRSFLPQLMRSAEAHICNVSSVNGFWASLGKGSPNTAYSASKFAVKGFTESLITDFALNAPHISVSVAMPGHVGTRLIASSRKIQERTDSDMLTPQEKDRFRARMIAQGHDPASISDAMLQAMSDEANAMMVSTAATTADGAARIILDGIRAGQWRILVGTDAEETDQHVRADPEGAYTDDFFRTRAPGFARQSEINQLV